MRFTGGSGARCGGPCGWLWWLHVYSAGHGSLGGWEHMIYMTWPGWQRPHWLPLRCYEGEKAIRKTSLEASWASLVAQLVKNPPAVGVTWVWSLGWEDPLEKGKATHSSILAWRIPWTVLSLGSKEVRHDWVTFTSLHFNTPEGTLLVQWLRIQCRGPRFDPWSGN